MVETNIRLPDAADTLSSADDMATSTRDEKRSMAIGTGFPVAYYQWMQVRTS